MRRWPLLLICLPGCLGFHDGGQSGSEDDIVEGAACTPSNTDIVSPQVQPSDVDFTALELLTPLEGAWSGDLLDPTTGDVLQGASMNLSYDGAPIQFTRFLASGFTADGTFVAGVESDTLCPPQYEIPASLQFSLADGSLNESLSVTLSTTSADFASLSAQIPVAQLVGTLRPVTFAEADFSSVNLAVTLFFQAASWQGDISWFASREDGNTVIDTSEPVGIVQLTQ
jgi:hypothetical protein